MEHKEILALSKELAVRLSQAVIEFLPEHTPDLVDVFKIVMTASATLAASAIVTNIDKEDFEHTLSCYRDIVANIVNDLEKVELNENR
jgi:hypothetical protein